MAANRARLVGLEPEIDALLVEDVAAEGQEPEHALVLELQQAYGAFQAVLLPPELLDARVCKCGEGLHHRPVEPGSRVDNHHIHRRSAEAPGGEQVLHEALAEADDGGRREEHDEYDDEEDRDVRRRVGGFRRRVRHQKGVVCRLAGDRSFPAERACMGFGRERKRVENGLKWISKMAGKLKERNQGVPNK